MASILLRRIPVPLLKSEIILLARRNWHVEFKIGVNDHWPERKFGNLRPGRAVGMRQNLSPGNRVISGIMAFHARFGGGKGLVKHTLSASTGSISLSAKALWGGSWGLLCVLALAAPILLSHARATAGSIVYLCFSGFCHQIPERSFFLSGYPMAVCCRCFGIYLGLVLGSPGYSPSVRRTPIGRRIFVFIAGFPLLLDALLPLAGLWQSTAASRFVTGLLLGYLISSLAARGVTEWLREFRRPLAIGALHRKGDPT